MRSDAAVSLWFVVLGSSLSLPVAAQTTFRASVDGIGHQGNNASGLWDPAIFSEDGRYVAFRSAATNLVPNDTNGRQDVFVRDLETGATERVSVSSTGVQADEDCLTFSMSADARYVAFWTAARTLVPNDTNGYADVFVRDRATGTTERVSVDSFGREADAGCYYAAISADGRFVAFYSAATNLVPGDTNGSEDVFVHDRVTRTTERVSLNSSGAQVQGNLYYCPSISGDGRYVVFSSSATDLVPGDTNGKVDVFVRDRQSATTQRISIGTTGLQGNQDSYTGAGPSISADGRYVVFTSLSSNLVLNDFNNNWDVFVHDRRLGLTDLVSYGASGVQGNAGSWSASISSDARFVAFSSVSTNLVGGLDTHGYEDVYVRDRDHGTIELISADADGMPGDSTSRFPTISSDGRLVAFESLADNLVPRDTNATSDIFIRDRSPIFVPFCFGDGTASPCPCQNSGATGHGCENSAATGGAELAAVGVPRLTADSLQLVASGELQGSLSVFYQSRVSSTGSAFGDGLRCLDGTLHRLHIVKAVGGTAAYPGNGDTPIHVLSAGSGDTLQAGFTRHYQVVYRDGSAAYCGAPTGGTFNTSNGVSVVWAP